jgi:hypothetical protein
MRLPRGSVWQRRIRWKTCTVFQEFANVFVRECLCVRHDTDLPEPALVGVTYVLGRADIETDGDLGRLYRVELMIPDREVREKGSVRLQ